MAGGACCAAPADENGPRDSYAAQRKVRGFEIGTLPMAGASAGAANSHWLITLIQESSGICVATRTHCLAPLPLCCASRMVRQAACALRQRWGGHLQVLGAEAGCSTEHILLSASTLTQAESLHGEPVASESITVAAAAAADRAASVVTDEPQGQAGEAGSAAVVFALYS